MSVIFTQSALLYSSADYPLTHARIGYNTITRGGTLSATSEAAGHPAYAAGLPNTYESWRPAASGSHFLTCDAGEATECDYIGMGAHDLGTSSAFVKAQYSFDNVTWADATDYITVTDNTPIMAFFSPITARYWRIAVNSTVTPSIGVWYCGKALAMQRPIYGGHSPITLSRKTVTRGNVSEGGQFLGRYIVRGGVETSVSWDNLSASWYRQHFDPFVESARTYPFFFAWRPLTFPREVTYCWTTRDISPSNIGIKDLMRVDMQISGIKEQDTGTRATPPGFISDDGEAFSEQSIYAIIPLSGAYSEVLVMPDDIADSETLSADILSGIYTDTVVSGDDLSDSETLSAAPLSGGYNSVVINGDAVQENSNLSADIVGGTYTEVVV